MLLRISALLWGYIFARFVIWPHRCEGILWLPTPNASSWYRLTTLKGAIDHSYLLPVFAYQNISRAVAVFWLPTRCGVAILITHVYSNLWWPAFLELKTSFGFCLICSIIQIGPLLYVFSPFVILDGLVVLWSIWISFYAWKIVKTPTTCLEYQRRQSRV